MVKRWFAIDVEAKAEAAEAVEYAFNVLDSLGTEIDHLRKSAGDDLTITGYFHELPDADLVHREIEEAIRIHDLSPESIKTITTREVEDTDWLAEWKRHWKPTEVGKFIIAPPWSEVGETDKIVIRIEPNMAFGTGTHETTKLCLDAIGRHYSPGQSFLDVGTGTGILAIAAAKLSGSAEIAAYETDADSVAIAKQNAELNGVGGQIEFFHGPIGEDTPIFDLVCANLTIDVIEPLLPLLLAKSRKSLVLSGILVEQKDMISTRLELAGVSNYEIEADGEWISVIVSRA